MNTTERYEVIAKQCTEADKHQRKKLQKPTQQENKNIAKARTDSQKPYASRAKLCNI